jgi:ribosomal protein S18 acetylase RimI-like enzyme
MHEVRYMELTDPGDPRWAEVEQMFVRLYRHMEASGLMLPLVDDGAARWMRTAVNTTGKFSHLVVAERDGRVFGFAQGMIRFLPDYLGGHPVGVITHVFVDENHRGEGAGKELTARLEAWFRLREVHSVELQVVAGNEAAMAFWVRLGYAVELRQLRKPLR